MLEPAKGLEVVRLFGGWVELETGLRLVAPVRLNGFDVVRLPGLEPGAELEGPEFELELA